jgi:hypothetical protein
MGGWGSGNFKADKKTPVEECICLDMGYLVRLQIVRPDVHRTGEMIWPDGTGGYRASLRYVVNTRQAPWGMHLTYPYWEEGMQTGVPLHYSLPLVTTPQHNNPGLRWWFACPISINEVRCTHRVVRMYLAAGQRYFACRYCLDLTYASRQTRERGGPAMREWPAITMEDIAGA